MPDLNDALGGQSVSYWIGLDGIDDGTNPDPIVIQAGFDANKQQDGTVTYEAWYEWFPNSKVPISTNDFSASAGESVAIGVTVTDAGTTAHAVFINEVTGQDYEADFFSPNEDTDARGQSAQWVIEEAPGTTLANFGTIQFINCAAMDANHVDYGVSGGTTVDLVVDGNTLATGAIASDTEVDATYTGP
ncbi:concanavalin A-like lectin/glucanase [Lophiostoma macrostomum CBS 122681]|uniref:Concanavalin A-like lectin/glucanase n=1 Tax=Lophiostoma macrostomum CBS 122681 TaxID=1314788 RepID=A0A6A6SL30_9PLEO|nr:concanavalin A-like lectin/glucanase [Lophiostoma macrostomum CBS 122681]